VVLEATGDDDTGGADGGHEGLNPKEGGVGNRGVGEVLNRVGEDVINARSEVVGDDRVGESGGENVILKQRGHDTDDVIFNVKGYWGVLHQVEEVNDGWDFLLKPGGKGRVS
jgi:hypothetical protein